MSRERTSVEKEIKRSERRRSEKEVEEGKRW